MTVIQSSIIRDGIVVHLLLKSKFTLLLDLKIVLCYFDLYYQVILSPETPNNGSVLLGTECALVCEEDYIPVARVSRTTHFCGLHGWENLDGFDMICEYSGKLNYM